MFSLWGGLHCIDFGLAGFDASLISLIRLPVVRLRPVMSVDSGDGSWKTKKGQNAGEIAKKHGWEKGRGNSEAESFG